MEIFISSVERVPGMIHQHGITHVLTLLANFERNELVLPSEFKRENWLALSMDDVMDDDASLAPTMDQVTKILSWGKALPDDAKLLVHCHAGISRSTAAALALMVQKLGVNRIQEAIDWLMDISPTAAPNPVITWYADQLLGANGVLHAKAEEIASAKLIRTYGYITYRGSDRTK